MRGGDHRANKNLQGSEIPLYNRYSLLGVEDIEEANDNDKLSTSREHSSDIGKQNIGDSKKYTTESEVESQIEIGREEELEIDFPDTVENRKMKVKNKICVNYCSNCADRESTKIEKP